MDVSDYIGNLIARSLAGTADALPAVRPRPRARFEPDGPAQGGWSEGEPDGEIEALSSFPPRSEELAPAAPDRRSDAVDSTLVPAIRERTIDPAAEETEIPQPLLVAPTLPTRRKEREPWAARPQVTRAAEREPWEVAPASQATPPAGIEQPPVVQVTIGRVEVRAASTNAPAARPPAHAVPTLEDYLKGGKA